MAIGEILWAVVVPADWRSRCLICQRRLDLREFEQGRVGAFVLRGAVGAFCAVHLGHGAKALQRLLEAGAEWWAAQQPPVGHGRPTMPGLVLPAGNYARLVTVLDNLHNGGYPA